jgi:hypothetical protein
MKKSFNIQELLHCKSKHHETKPMHPSSSRAFQRHQEHNLRHPSSVDLITTKQNKASYLSFIDRLYHFLLASLGDDNWLFDLEVRSFHLQRHLVGNKEEEEWFFADGFYNNFKLQLTLLELQCVFGVYWLPFAII